MPSYYSEEMDLADYESNWSFYDRLRSFSTRLSDGARVGYYGGDSITTGSTSTLSPILEVTNAEKLTVLFKCVRPSSSSGELTFKVRISDESGHSVTKALKRSDNSLTKIGRTFYRTLSLDDLSSDDTRFYNCFGAGNTYLQPSECLTPGERLTISLTVSSVDMLVEEKTLSATTNSLFADDSTSTEARIKYGRHLQNLDVLSTKKSDGAFVNPKITKAVLSGDIAFKDTLNDEGWYSAYGANGMKYFNGTNAGGALFRPIHESSLTSFDGKSHVISGLNIATKSEPAGLFASAGNMALGNAKLAGATVVSESGNSGALVGIVNGETSISNCGVYLANTDIKNKTHTNEWQSGTTVGGLVGSLSNEATLSITGSFASTVLRGTTVGGLVGNAEGSLTITTSYADSYIFGADVAGLVAAVGESGEVELENCYAAGFLYPTESAAGLVDGAVAAASQCYTICAPEGNVAFYSTARSIESDPTALYYFHGSDAQSRNVAGTESIAGRTADELKELLGDEFVTNTTTDTTSTHAYNLKNQSLSTYDYPRLKANHHYGDWEAEFQEGALVYYEKYLTGYGRLRYGFFGANVESTLVADDTVTGDGYGMVYRATDALPKRLKVVVEGYESSPYEFEPASTPHYTVQGADDVEYHIYPLPTQMVNAAPDENTTSFYNKVTITSGSSDETQDEEGEARLWYYNPHFAKSAYRLESSDANVPMSPIDDQAIIRTPRHLYSLSRYYGVCQEVIGEATLYQERDVNYSSYEWPAFYDANTKTIASQEPIGAGDTHFMANYNGQCHVIYNVSFMSEAGPNVGLFGYNEGTIQNVVIMNDYVEDDESTHYKVECGSIGTNNYVSMGVLAGYNGSSGMLINCAVAGYSTAGASGTINAYSNSHLYVGGLVGQNDGVVRRCAADTPEMNLSTLNSEAYAAGFVGMNNGSGVISDCYDLGHLEVVYSRGGSVVLAGFAAQNNGSISDCYCATSLITSGDAASSYPFAPKGGVATGCQYLNSGTYRYIGNLHSYQSGENSTNTSGAGKIREDLVDSQGERAPSIQSSFKYPGQHENLAYPYRAVVTDGDGNWAHYGDWQSGAELGTMGMFYWEHEDGGTNNGYHLTYIGTDENNATAGTTLCTAHDDGGEILEYGYGYYVQKGQEDKVTCETERLEIGGSVNEGAKASLEEQLSAFTFYPYTTSLSGDDRICLSGNSTDSTPVRDGVFTLSFAGDETSSSYDYIVSPYFANALYREGAGTIEASDGTVTNYGIVPGETDNPYEIRSEAQLQYINWNDQVRNRNTLVNGTSNHKAYPYLQYATVTRQGLQGDYQSDVEALRPVQTWIQTHDVIATSGDFTPIAGTAVANASINDYKMVLYGWFGGSYDGMSYKLQNFKVNSDSFSVGLFGVTVGANMKNVIMYSDDSSMIERNTNIDGGQVGNHFGSYVVGGLVGIAYDYDTSVNTSNVITNCAIAGYTIKDSSTNIQSLGEANVGGLIGTANVKLEKCSAVLDIVVDCKRVQSGKKEPSYGNYLRVGGLTGATRLTVTDCYTGGRIRVTEDTVNEKPDWYGSNKKQGERDYASHIYIAGVSGSAFSANYSNFTNGNSAADGTTRLYNCYTFMDLPDLEGTIKGIAIMASPADRYGQGTRVVMSNCYYLDTVANIGMTKPDYKFTTGWDKNVWFDSAGYEDAFEKMLYGNMNINQYIIQGAGNQTNTSGDLTGVTYAELEDAAMSGRLGGNWDWVTTTEGAKGTAVDGKYSFPGSRNDLFGKNYPFPTIVTQPDPVFDTTVNVHYGEWPATGIVWSKGLASMDIFKDMNSEGWAEQTFTLSDTQNILEDRTPTITVADSSMAQITSVTRNGTSFDVTVRALKDGAVTIIAKDDETGASASFVLEITAKIAISTDPSPVVNHKGKTSSVKLLAKSKLDSNLDYSTSGTWKLSESEFIDIKAPSPGSNVCKITHHESGLVSIEVTYSYVYNAKSYGTSSPIQIKTYDSIGLSINPALLGEGEKISYVEAVRAASAGTVVGTNKDYDAEDSPSLPKALKSTTLYWYELLTDAEVGGKALSGVTINTIRISAGTGEYIYNRSADGTYVGDGPFTVSVGGVKEIEKDSAYEYLGCDLRYTGSEAIDKVSVTTSLTHEEDEGTTYELSTSFNAPKHVLTFEANGGKGTTASIMTSAGSVKLPECGFVKTGYTFAGWMAENGEVCAAGDSVDVLEDATYTAQWSPIAYAIAFDANGGAGDAMDSLQCAYDQEQVLPECSYTLEGHEFTGWGTSEAGGTVYQPGDIVKNLTAQPDATVTLFAQWAEVHALTLDGSSCGLETKTFNVLYGVTTTLDGYEEPRIEGRRLLGWYTKASDGEKVLEADGSIYDVVKGFTSYDGTNLLFVLSEDKTLYPQWVDCVYLVANGEAVEYAVDELASTYEAPTCVKDHYELEGWYTAEDGGSRTKVLDADGNVMEGQELTYNLRLYAHWTKTLYLTNPFGSEAGAEGRVSEESSPFNSDGNKWYFRLNIGDELAEGNDASLDLENGEWLEASIDLSTCGTWDAGAGRWTSVKKLQNLISIGSIVNTWQQGSCAHFYYPVNTNDTKLRIDFRGSWTKQSEWTGNDSPFDPLTPLRIKFNSGGLYLVNNEDGAETLVSSSNDALSKGYVCIASQEGNTRSFASNYNIAVHGDYYDSEG